MPRYDTIQVRRDTAAQWASINPVLLQGEMGLESDTNKFKFGDGMSTWSNLSYAVPTAYPSNVNGTVTTTTTSGVIRNITLSTASPSGGNDGDVWLQYS